MNLTGGQYKGFKINTPKNTRPTLSKVRESVFNVLFQYFPNQGTFLDMFAGSGIMGLEAVSRGYTVVALEINPKTASEIKSNYNKLKLNSSVIVCNAMKYNTNDKYDVIYIDPPWSYDYNDILVAVSKLLNVNGIAVVEYDNERNINLACIAKNNSFEIIKEKKYGRVLVSYLRQII